MNNQVETANEKIIARVRKLYEMSKQQAESPMEAMIALKRCNSLMDRYGITADDLKTSDFDTLAIHTIRSNMPTYIRVLASAAALLHDCITVRNENNIEYRGYSIDVQIAKMTFEYLKDALDRSLSVAKKSGDVCGGRSPAHDYRCGFALEVHRRCKAINTERRANTQENQTRQALVTEKMAMVKLNCSSDLSKSKCAPVKYRRSEAGSNGRKAGANVSLNTQVESASNNVIKRLTNAT